MNDMDNAELPSELKHYEDIQDDFLPMIKGIVDRARDEYYREKEKEPYQAVNLWPPGAGRFMMVFKLDDLGVDYTDVSFHYRMALAESSRGYAQPQSAVRAKAETYAEAYLMRLVTNVVQTILELEENDPENASDYVYIARDIMRPLQEYEEFEMLIGRVADMATSVRSRLPDGVTYVHYIGNYRERLAYIFAGQTPLEE
jgi:hypothetical protein